MLRSPALRRNTALAALLVLSACASAGRPAPDPYFEVNRSLRGERAIVELAGGEVAQGVSHVQFTPTEATWIEDHRTRRVPVDAVSRVIVVSRPSRAPAGIALLVGLGLSIFFDDPRPLDLALYVALDPFVWGAEVSPAVGHVVYTGVATAP